MNQKSEHFGGFFYFVRYPNQRFYTLYPCTNVPLNPFTVAYLLRHNHIIMMEIHT